jgi:hypothetical protein
MAKRSNDKNVQRVQADNQQNIRRRNSSQNLQQRDDNTVRRILNKNERKNGQGNK